MNRSIRIAALCSLLAAVVGVGPSAAAEPEQHGWWWRVQVGIAGAELPPSPDVPEDGLVVEQVADGPTAVSAVRIAVAEDDADPVLVLQPVQDDGVTGVAACLTTTAWHPTQAGRWDDQPLHDCEAGRVDGGRADDGSWTFALDALIVDGIVDVMLVPADGTPGRVTFEAPGPDAVLTTTAPPPPPEPQPDPTQPAPVQPQPEPRTAPPPSTFTSPLPPPVAPPTVQEPQVAPAPQAEPAAPAPAAPVAPVAAPTFVEVTGPSPLAVAMLSLIALALVANSARNGPPGRASDLGGIGRFRKQRTDAAAPLW